MTSYENRNNNNEREKNKREKSIATLFIDEIKLDINKFILQFRNNKDKIIKQMFWYSFDCMNDEELIL